MFIDDKFIYEIFLHGVVFGYFISMVFDFITTVIEEKFIFRKRKEKIKEKAGD